MEVGDFAILKRELYKLSTSLVPVYIPTEIGRIGRVRNARYSRKFDEEEHLTSLELLFVSDVSGLYFYRLKPNKVELIGNDKETPKRIEEYFESLKTDSNLTHRQREIIDKLDKHFGVSQYDLKKAMNDYNILLTADLNVKCPRGDMEKLKQIDERIREAQTRTFNEMKTPSLRFPHQEVYNGPINARYHGAIIN